MYTYVHKIYLIVCVQFYMVRFGIFPTNPASFIHFLLRQTQITFLKQLSQFLFFLHTYPRV